MLWCTTGWHPRARGILTLRPSWYSLRQVSHYTLHITHYTPDPETFLVQPETGESLHITHYTPDPETFLVQPETGESTHYTLHTTHYTPDPGTFLVQPDTGESLHTTHLTLRPSWYSLRQVSLHTTHYIHDGIWLWVWEIAQFDKQNLLLLLLLFLYSRGHNSAINSGPWGAERSQVPGGGHRQWQHCTQPWCISRSGHPLFFIITLQIFYH